MSLLGKRIFTHPSIFTFNHAMNASGTNLLKLSKLIQIIVNPFTADVALMRHCATLRMSHYCDIT